MEKRLYLDCAATTPVSKASIWKMRPYFDEKFGNSHSIHAMGREAEDAVEKSRVLLLNLIGGKRPEEIVFTGGGTDSNTLAILGMLPYLRKIGKTNIVATDIEHRSLLDVLKYAELLGFSVTMGHNRHGIFAVKDFEKAVSDDTGMITCMLVNNETGDNVMPYALPEFCKEKGIVLHSDFVQAFPKSRYEPYPDVDIASVSGHKFGAPKGIGFLYVRRGIPFENLARGTENVPYIVAMANAAEEYTKADEAYSTKSAEFRRLVYELTGGKCISNTAAFSTDICSIYFPDIDAETMVLALSAKGVMASAGAACDSHSMQASHVLLNSGFSAEHAKSSVRFSFGVQTSDEEVREAAKIVADTYNELAKGE